MTPELTILALAGLFQVFQMILMAFPANLELGTRKTASARDLDRMGGKSMQEQLSTKPARLFRAMNNHFEALILFTLAVVVVQLSGQNSNFTANCAYTYLVARVAYVPAYYFGLNPWRSAIWFVGIGATIFMLISTMI